VIADYCVLVYEYPSVPFVVYLSAAGVFSVEHWRWKQHVIRNHEKIRCANLILVRIRQNITLQFLPKKKRSILDTDLIKMHFL
jgi:hypothetical protein